MPASSSRARCTITSSHPSILKRSKRQVACLTLKIQTPQCVTMLLASGSQGTTSSTPSQASLASARCNRPKAGPSHLLHNLRNPSDFQECFRTQDTEPSAPNKSLPRMHLEMSSDEVFWNRVQQLQDILWVPGRPGQGVSWRDKSQWARTAPLIILNGSGNPDTSE